MNAENALCFSLFEEWRNRRINTPYEAETSTSKSNQRDCSNDLVSFPASRLHVRQVLGRMRLLRVTILAHVRVRVLLLVEVTEGVVDLAMLTLICAD
jgi:hypothetical protein